MSSMPNDPCLHSISGSLHCLSPEQRIGLTIATMASLFSLCALAYVYVFILCNIIWRIRNLPRFQWQLFDQPMDLLILSLFAADTLQAIGGVLNFKWVQDGKVEVGNFCDAQGILKIFGAAGVALNTLIIAIWTFRGIWMQRPITSKGFTLCTITGIWLFISAMAIAGKVAHPNILAPTPYWCWIHDYFPWKIFSEYVWIWIALLVSLVVYIPLYFWMRGILVNHNPQWWRVTLQSPDLLNNFEMAVRRRAFIMAAYPFVYAICVLPFSVVRMITFVQELHNGDIDFVPGLTTATLVVASIFQLSGLFNVVLLLTTRPDIGLFGNREGPQPLQVLGPMPVPQIAGASAPPAIGMLP